jgi:hypothetical protein
VRGLKDASRQLKRNGAQAKPGAPKGVIAISLSRIIAGGNRFSSRIQWLTNPSCKKSSTMNWRPIAGGGREHRRSIVPFALPADVGHGDHFALLSCSNVYQPGANREALALLNQAIEPLYRDAVPDLMNVHAPGS